MAIVKKRNERTEARLLLESDDPVELPPAEIEEKAVLLQFETFRPYLHELLDALRAGTWAEPVPVMMDGSTFVVHGATRSFWVKLWHSSAEMTRVERAQVMSCLPSTRGVQIVVGDPEDYDDDNDSDDDYADDEEEYFDEDAGGGDDADTENEIETR
ncbi:MAG: hypothetical protein ACRD68_13020 [Pyrinomonadaceae bacterium]